MRIDHHFHTTLHSPDSAMTPEAMIDRAVELGLDALIVTEHDHQWSQEELAEINQRSRGILVLSGVEVSAREGHFLVYGLPDLADVGVGITLKELLEVARRRGAAVVAAHPYRWGQDFERIAREFNDQLDALELASKNVDQHTRFLVERDLKRFPHLGCTGSSDAHHVNELGCYYSELDGTIQDMAGFVQALKQRRLKPRHHPAPSMVLTCGTLDED
ncbi:PHP domain protein [Isosphaera pallida ATCC 43644]|uniref:PHP domain protein n=1 Tax=Isosphaera pallida (strain ATCC 43644 / DSM 9630 / IS1B) TaxID=575540 RepID=E8R2D6_ISOPI|nr:PHP domain-containing protein [Isosphaera pallida]ADV61421.1 PHP domain protein [Isosphaera pallida ATCC 43644]